MKKFIDSEATIYDNFIDIVTDRFSKLKYGIQSCSRPLCDDLVTMRYELLQWQKNWDLICDDPTPPATMYDLVWGYSPIDPFGDEENLFFQFGRQNLRGATEISMDYTAGSAGNYLFWRIPSDEPVFDSWENTITNYGDIPDQIWRTKKTIGGYDYYVTRDLYFANPETTILTFFSSGTVPTDPIVNAGPDQTLMIPVVSGTVIGTFTPGTYPVVNYQWSLQSGLPVTFGTATSLTTTFTTSGIGTYVLKLTVFDTNSDAYSDTVTINVITAPFRAYYGFRSDNSVPLTEADILAGNSIPIVDGVSQYTLPLQTAPGAGYVWFAEKSDQPVKIKWQDSVIVGNNGFIGGLSDTFGPNQTITTFRLSETQFATQFDNPIIIKSV